MYRNTTRKIIVLMLFMMTSTLASLAQQYAWTQRFYFELDRDEIRYDLRGNHNRAMMDSTATILRSLMADTTVTTLRLDIISSSSLEASNAYNSRLTARRTSAFLRELRSRIDIPYHVLYVHENVFDWDQLYQLTAKSNCPEKEQALSIIRSVPTTVLNKQADSQRKIKLQQLAGGATYEYMKTHLFPDMRNTSVTISASHQPRIITIVDTVKGHDTRTPTNLDSITPPPPQSKKPRAILGVKTNMLYDVAVTPNIGIEFYIAPQFTIAANWAYAWWHKDSKSRYWRAYGGDLEARYYFRKPDDRNDRIANAFRGHHVGLYGALCTYDFEFGNNGQQGAKWNYGGGISYGYSIPITKRLNIDFTLGLGCLYGDYYTYDPSTIKKDDYYWTATKQRKYWGPTKAEVSLVWVLGK